MRKLYTLTIATVAILFMSGCTGSSQNVAPVEKKPLSIMEINAKVADNLVMIATETDPSTICSIDNGVKNVLEMAKLFNKAAIEKGLEFRRLGVNNSGLIASVEDAVKTGAKEVNPKDFKGKTSKTKLETNFAAERACRFAVVALIQSVEAKSTWKNAVPGDGLKY